MYDADNYCPMFFKGMYTWVDGEQSHVGHCCISGISKNIARPDFDHPYLTITRNTWQSKPRPECHQCWKSEQQGNFSKRQNYIDWFKNTNLDPVVPELVTLDFSVGAVCNAKCIMCNGGSSTTWAAEDFKFGIKKYQHILKTTADTDQIRTLDVSKLRQLYITGGEPLMSSRVQSLLEHIKQNGDISNLEFSCNTNGSVFPDDQLIELWQQCRSVDLHFSIDATGKEFEYIRNPLKWDKVDANIRAVKQLKLNVNIAVAAGVHNIDTLPDLYAWFQTLELPSNAFSVNQCWGQLGFDSASESLKQVWRDNLNSIQQPWVDTVQRMISNAGQAHDQTWQHWLKNIDRRRNFQWQEQLPKLAIAKNKAACYTL